MSANDFDIFQHDGHKLQACGGSTGHFIKTVAMCDSAAIANFLLTAVNAYDKQRALIETLVKALDEAADFIQPFNRADELLEKIEAALAAAKEQSA